MQINAEFPPKLSGLFKPCRYKVAYGGRGGAKSWAFARALLIKAVAQETRVLCAREVQKSIKQSVHALLDDQIQSLGLGFFFEVLETEIRGRNGSRFNFAGLASHTVESIKSYEGCDIVWVEEAQTVSKKSWDILIPTIRKPKSEIWVSFNPDLDTDDTYIRFVENTPPDTLLVKINYSDNPWFPEVLERERLHCLQTTPKDYKTIWQGECKAAVDGAIYADEVSQAQEDKRVCSVELDKNLPVHVIFDLGWNDSMFISLVQRGANELRFIESIEDSHKTLEYYSALLKAKKLNYGKLFLPHDGATKDFKTGKSSEEILTELGWMVEVIDRTGIEEGIKIARSTFSKCWFDKEKTQPMINALKRYKRQIPTATGEPGAPLHDAASHGADNFRYVCLAADRMTDSAEILKRGAWLVWPENEQLPTCVNIFLSLHTSFSEKDSKLSAYNAMTRWGIFWHEQRERYCIIALGKAWVENCGYEELRAFVKEENKKHNPDGILVDSKSIGKSLYQDLRRAIPGKMRGYIASEDFISRAHSVSPMLQSGQVYVPNKNWAVGNKEKGVIGLIDYAAAFPYGSQHSFAVTSTITQALIYLRNGNWAGEHDDDKEIELTRKDRSEEQEEDLAAMQEETRFYG